MNKTLIRSLMALSASLGLLFAGPGIASADEPTGRAYGQHVVECAQGMGFNGEDNPGVHHHGFSGWDGMPC